ncbi:hypothetical protein [uncultured Alistipes sp.]|uniref:hypothetical protein n=1 Tax=uncultured Alistipes sp. TaxID=538949 RepID=UPI0025E5D201|nr:hypothetical protein [uncultured Alistipes sp.]
MSNPNMYKQASSNNITLEPYPFPSELGMEAYLMDNPSILKLDDRKYGEPQIIECEMSIGKCTNRKTRGRIDMVVRYGEDLFGILELKKHALDKDTLFQLCDYLAEREKIVEAINQSDAVEVDLDPENVKFVGVLVGGYIDDELRKEMPITDLKNNNLLKEHPRQQTIQGYTDQISAIMLERFRNPHTCEIVVISTPIVKTSVKDTTKYQIDGEGRYGKAKLVHEIVKRYVKQHPEASIDRLEKIFPTPRLIRTLGVFAEAQVAKKRADRYYADRKMLIALGDGVKIATCNQWAKESIDEFIANVEKQKLGFEIAAL